MTVGKLLRFNKSFDCTSILVQFNSYLYFLCMSGCILLNATLIEYLLTFT